MKFVFLQFFITINTLILIVSGTFRSCCFLNSIQFLRKIFLILIILEFLGPPCVCREVYRASSILERTNCNGTFSWGCPPPTLRSPLANPLSRAPVVPSDVDLIMAAFMVGKSLKDRRQTKAIEELFDKADKNGNGKISVQEYVMIFSDHGITLR